MAEKLSYASSINLKEVLITSVDGKTTLNITDLVIRFDYFESISLPTISGNLDLVDTGGNLISSLPIQGYEDIQITVEVPGNDQYEYKFKVYKIYNRFSGDRFQTYSLGLISKEALINEQKKVPRTLSGKSDQIVRQLLSDDIKTTKQIKTDPSLFEINFHPGKRTPFSIIETLKPKTVSQDSKNSAEASTSSSEYGKASGSAGYYFYETREGYNFNSIDRLNSLTKNSPVAVYTQENVDVGGPATLKITDIDFEQEIDLLTKLRMGTFSSVVCYYNYSTGAYEEQIYKLEDSFGEMEHLGSQSGLPTGQSDLSAEPTRIMSILIDHETWFDSKEIGSPEERDGGSGNTAPFPDFQKFFAVQSIARLNSQNNQQVKLQVPINASLMVGQTVEIQIPNQIPTNERQSEIYDPEHSGVYLIAQLNHAYEPKKAMGNTFLTLIRDSYGRPDEPSKTKTKSSL